MCERVIIGGERGKCPLPQFAGHGELAVERERSLLYKVHEGTNAYIRQMLYCGW